MKWWNYSGNWLLRNNVNVYFSILVLLTDWVVTALLACLFLFQFFILIPQAARSCSTATRRITFLSIAFISAPSSHLHLSCSLRQGVPMRSPLLIGSKQPIILRIRWEFDFLYMRNLYMRHLRCCKNSRPDKSTKLDAIWTKTYRRVFQRAFRWLYKPQLFYEINLEPRSLCSRLPCTLKQSNTLSQINTVRSPVIHHISWIKALAS